MADLFTLANMSQEARDHREHVAKSNATPAQSFRLDPQMMADFKIACAKEHRTMTSVVQELIAGWTRDHG